VVICLEQGANVLHMVQLMPLPPHYLSLIKIQNSLALLVPAYPGFPGKEVINRCLYLMYYTLHHNTEYIVRSRRGQQNWFRGQGAFNFTKFLLLEKFCCLSKIWEF